MVVIDPAIKINWENGFLNIKGDLIINSVTSSEKEIKPNGKEIKGIILPILSNFDLFILINNHKNIINFSFEIN